MKIKSRLVEIGYNHHGNPAIMIIEAGTHNPKLGFELEKPSVFYRINLMVNFIDLIWMYAIAKGKFSIPKIWNEKK